MSWGILGIRYTNQPLTQLRVTLAQKIGLLDVRV